MEPLAPGMGDTTASEAWGDCETLGDDRRKLGRGRVSRTSSNFEQKK